MIIIKENTPAALTYDGKVIATFVDEQSGRYFKKYFRRLQKLARQKKNKSF